MDRRFRRVALLSEKNGFYRDLDRHFVTFERGNNTCIVTFDDMKSRDVKGPRFPWSYSFCQKHNYSRLGVMMVKRNDWFRQRRLAEFFDELRDNNFFDQFDNVVFYGSSMGGYGALTYAASYPRARAIAFTPQTSLDVKHVPWEDRYDQGRQEGDWSFDDYADAAETVPKIKRAQIFYDPYFVADRKHADRLAFANVDHFRCPFLGHKAPRYFKYMGILSNVVTHAIEGSLDQDMFKRMFRQRRDSALYARIVAHRAFDRDRAVFGSRAVDWIEKNYPDRPIPVLKRKAEQARIKG